MMDEHLAMHILHKHIHDEALRDHCMMVGRLAGEVHQNLEEGYQESLCAGIVHDVGKAYCSIDSHPAVSYAILRAYDETTAQIALCHHQFQQHPYPRLEGGFFHGACMNHLWEAQIVALCDKYEAYRTRSHRKHLEAIAACRAEYDFDLEMLTVLRNIGDQVYTGKL
jgi:HD-GYP domain-containing protein (c-di-GMP phosphodiesterase class II)